MRRRGGGVRGGAALFMSPFIQHVLEPKKKGLKNLKTKRTENTLHG
jgi:hypothetical protein